MILDLASIRTSLATTPAAFSDDISSTMANPPQPKDIYAPPDHGAALDPRRVLVVGARGMGKSFWAGAYVSEDARHSLADLYPRIGLNTLITAEGFTGEEGTEAPSKRVIARLIDDGTKPDELWRAVILKAIALSNVNSQPSRNWSSWVADVRNVEEAEAAFATASERLVKSGRRLIVVFDALDRLADDWPQIRLLTMGLLRTALDFRAYRGLGLKIFMRPDQFDDGAIFGFPDASKLRAEAVRLDWLPKDLYGLVFTILARDEGSADQFSKLASSVKAPLEDVQGLKTLSLRLKEDQGLQENLFVHIAGRYMGADHRRGRTYTWLTNHLADSKGEVSPRSFLRALAQAARNAPAPARLAIDANGIREGIKAASKVRFDQLREDHEWATTALEPLADQRVPGEEREFLDRWRAARTIKQIMDSVRRGDYKSPVELLDAKTGSEQALLNAFIRLGVVERREDERINMPDIYRVAANLLRKGGVPVRRRGR